MGKYVHLLISFNKVASFSPGPVLARGDMCGQRGRGQTEMGGGGGGADHAGLGRPG